MNKALVFLANGLEECEGLITIDLLRRAGVEVTTASIHDTTTICSSHKIIFEADALARDLDLDAFDLVFLPGGLVGTKNLSESDLVKETARKQLASGKLLAAICAAPSVLGQMHLLEGKKATCYPGFETQLFGAEYTAATVTEDGNIITGKGMGATIPFALHLIARLEGQEKAVEIRDKIVYPFDF